MALLTAEDVLNKAFSKTKYREGFDQDEVDDFLDEVAHTISSLIAERDDLAARLQAAQAGQPMAPSPAQPAPAPAPAGDPSAGLLGMATDPNQSPTGMLAMAQKLHDEYVTSGEAEKSRIIAEAKEKAESIVQQAQGDAESRLQDLTKERAELERKIDDLRRFERDYRARLTSYLENLLGDLDHGAGRDQQPGDAPAVTPAPPSSAPQSSSLPWGEVAQAAENTEATRATRSDAPPAATPEQPRSAEHAQSPYSAPSQAPQDFASVFSDVPSASATSPSSTEMPTRRRSPFDAVDEDRTNPPSPYGGP